MAVFDKLTFVVQLALKKVAPFFLRHPLSHIACRTLFFLLIVLLLQQQDDYPRLFPSMVKQLKKERFYD